MAMKAIVTLILVISGLQLGDARRLGNVRGVSKSDSSPDLSKGHRGALASTHVATRQVGAAVGANSGGGSGSTVHGTNAEINSGEKGETTIESSLGSMVMSMLTSDKPSIHEVSEAALSKMDLSDALDRVDEKLPADIASLARLTSKAQKEGKGELAVDAKSQGFSEASLQKARRILNSMVESSQTDLDAAVIECKEFCLRNRRTYSQVQTDLARLGSQIADLERKRAEASEGIAQQSQARETATSEMEVETRNYQTVRLANNAEMTIRKNDLAVFAFVLAMVKCKGSASSSMLVQLDASGNETAPLEVCDTNDGLELKFDDPKMQAKLESFMTPQARQAIRQALGEQMAFSSLQQPAAGNATTTQGAMTAAMPTVPPAQAPNPRGQWKKCTGMKPNCGLLHDTMSIQWGKFKDLVDSLQSDMDKNQDNYEELQANHNDMLSTITGEKGTLMQMQAETISALNAETQERSEKDLQERDLRKEYEKRMSQYKARISEILFTNICAVKQVRNSVMAYSSSSPPAKITDCDVGEWVPGTCSIECDDACPQPDPYACGGWQALTREAVVSPNQFGINCPPLTNKKKCNQIRCPINCVMSQWSGWAKCTKECEGGVQARSRSILTKPKNGGTLCDTVQESRQCNTGSCDRDCTLVPWADWSPCSMACSGGLQTRQRRVLVPIRGQGKCPRSSSPNRFAEKQCNMQACVGDEICIAQQDLIIALDASGSLRQSGFDTLRNFASNITSKYKSLYYGMNDMKVGLVVFGNGEVEEDGTIRSAINGQELTFDLDQVRTSIQAVQWQRGFTNMAQAFALADTMLGRGGRSAAQSAVLMLTDGKASFQFQTTNIARTLKDKNTMIFMVPVTDLRGNELAFLRQTASQPWETNFERIPGMLDLANNPEMFAATMVAKFCPDSVSPSAIAAAENDRGYLMIRENGVPSDECAQFYFIGAVASMDDCAGLARNRGLLGFAFGKGQYANLHCRLEVLESTEALWEQWQANRTAPACPSSNPNAAWVDNPYFDSYAVRPIGAPGGL